MTRTGWTLTLAGLLLLVALASMVRVGGPSPTREAAPATRSAAVTGPAPVAGAGLRVPVQGIARAAVTDDWGDPRGGGTRAHEGVDIPAPGGTPVVAAADGRVEKLFTSDLGGLTIYQRSADGGSVFYYAHLDRYAPTLTEGQAVRAGQVLGQVGASGDAEAASPHLHFEVHRMAPGEGWWQGRAIDPAPLLRAGAG